MMQRASCSASSAIVGGGCGGAAMAAMRGGCGTDAAMLKRLVGLAASSGRGGRIAAQPPSAAAVAMCARRAMATLCHPTVRRPAGSSSLRRSIYGSHTTSSGPSGHAAVLLMCRIAPTGALRFNGSSSSTINADPLHEDLYARLGVGRGADKQDIKQNYRHLAKLYHPDQNQGDKTAEEKFRRIKEAYEILSDHGRRKTYDATGSAGAASQGEWKHGTYTYTSGNFKMSPMRMYLGIAATTWILVMMIRWLMDGTILENLTTFLTIVACISFFGRIVGACLIFYFFAPSQQVRERERRGVSDTSTVVVTAYVSPHSATKPTRVVRLTGVDKHLLPRRLVEFSVTWAGMTDPSAPLVLLSKVGEAHVQLPDAVGINGVKIKARTIQDDGTVVHETLVDLS